MIAIVNLTQSRSSAPRHASGKRLFEVADVSVDNCVPPGDASQRIAGLAYPIGALSTIAGAAIAHSIFIVAADALARRGNVVRNFPSANTEGIGEADLLEIMEPYRHRIRYFR